MSNNFTDHGKSFDFNAAPPADSVVDNFTAFKTPWGDSDPLVHNLNDQPEDFTHDTAGVPADGGMSTMSILDMGLAPNQFPRETGHDSLTDEEAQLS
jgi:hypothetical protein